MFKKLELGDIETIKPFFHFSGSRINDNTVATTIMWRDFFFTEYLVLDETLILKVKFLDLGTSFAVPMGKDVPKALCFIRQWCEEHETPMIICNAATDEVEALSAHLSFDSRVERDLADYLYKAEDLAWLAGKKYNGQRNHINHFLRTYEYSLEELKGENIKEALDLLDRLGVEENPTPIYLHERAVTIEVLERYETYGMDGLALRANGTVVAFAVGEALNGVLFVHIEKSDSKYRGAPQMIASRYVQHMLGAGITHVNREEDLGDEGLRKSKLSYHPVEMLQKHTLFIK
ncbi:MAG: phosphatidylglycerol lysyltransferase domain-containing protein [Clostridiales bacterium]|jgi:hypothetical protein|nr:phosphatidylglycerol lysyltransferase domain-containing protein [Clostridiales bacterium]